MQSFPRSLRILPLASVLQTILAVYTDKSRHDDELRAQKLPVLSLGEYLHYYYSKTLGEQTEKLRIILI